MSSIVVSSELFFTFFHKECLSRLQVLQPVYLHTQTQTASNIYRNSHPLLLLRQLLLVVFAFLLLFASIILPLELKLCNFHMQFVASNIIFIQKLQCKFNRLSLLRDRRKIQRSGLYFPSKSNAVYIICPQKPPCKEVPFFDKCQQCTHLNLMQPKQNKMFLKVTTHFMFKKMQHYFYLANMQIHTRKGTNKDRMQGRWTLLPNEIRRSRN